MTLEELNKIRDEESVQIAMRREDHARTRVVVGMGNLGISGGARKVLKTFADLVQENKMTDKVTVLQDGSIGEEQYIPFVTVTEPGKETVSYVNMTPEKAEEVFKSHLVGGRVLEKYTLQKAEGR